MSREKLQNETATGEVDVDAVLARMKEALCVSDDSDLGLELGVQAATTFKVWRNRRAIPQSYYAKVAEKTSKSVQWLKTGVSPAPRLRNETDVPALSDGFVMVPRYDVQASAGAGSLIHSELIVDHLAFRHEWVSKMGLIRQKLALIEVHGDSMEPSLKNSDLVLIDLRNGGLSADGIYVIQHRGHLLVKRIQCKFDGTVVIKSDNPAYESEVLNPSDAESLVIVGRVVWFGRGM